MDNITISMEEYKELLIIKGKYEELKSQKSTTINWNPREIRTTENENPYKVICEK